MIEPPQQRTAVLVDKIVFNEKYTQYIFEWLKPSVMNFLAGQYVSIKVNEAGLRRPYSICSSSDKNHGFDLLVDQEPRGVGTTYLDSLQLGEQIATLAPMGKFVLPEEIAEPEIVFVATGAGIAPLRSMILDLLQLRQETRPITLYWGMRHVEQLFWMEEFQQLVDAFSNFHFHPTVSQPISGWSLCRGRVTDCLAVHEVTPDAVYYLCGSTPMIQSVTEVLGQRGVDSKALNYEKFF